MKKVLIIENDFNDWSLLSSILIDDYDVYPKERFIFDILSSNLSVRYGEGNDPSSVEQAKKEIIAFVEEVGPDLFLVDYELKKTEDLCNGLRFISEFLSRKKIIIVTSVKDGGYKNKIIEMSEKPTNGNRIRTLFKDRKKKENFRIRLQTMVAEMIGDETDMDIDIDPIAI